MRPAWYTPSVQRLYTLKCVLTVALLPDISEATSVVQFHFQAVPVFPWAESRSAEVQPSGCQISAVESGEL